MEVMTLATLVEKFGGQPLTSLIKGLHPTLKKLPEWCSTFRLPKQCVVGSVEDLCPAGDEYFFAHPEEFVQRALLPDPHMGPGENCLKLCFITLMLACKPSGMLFSSSSLPLFAS